MSISCNCLVTLQLAIEPKTDGRSIGYSEVISWYGFIGSGIKLFMNVPTFF